MFDALYQHMFSVVSLLKGGRCFKHRKNISKAGFRACARVLTLSFVVSQTLTPVMAVGSTGSWTSCGLAPGKDDYLGSPPPSTRSQRVQRRASATSPSATSTSSQYQEEVEDVSLGEAGFLGVPVAVQDKLEAPQAMVFGHLVTGVMETMTPYERFCTHLKIHRLISHGLMSSLHIEKESSDSNMVRVVLPSLQLLPKVRTWMEESQESIAVMHLYFLEQGSVADIDYDALSNFLGSAPNSLQRLDLHMPMSYRLVARLMESPKNHLILPSLEPFLGPRVMADLQGRLRSQGSDGAGGPRMLAMGAFGEAYAWRDAVEYCVSRPGRRNLVEWVQEIATDKMLASLKTQLHAVLGRPAPIYPGNIRVTDITAGDFSGGYLGVSYMAELGRTSSDVREIFYRYLKRGLQQPDAKKLLTLMFQLMEASSPLCPEMIGRCIQFADSTTVPLNALTLEGLPAIDREWDQSAPGSSGISRANVGELHPENVRSLVPLFSEWYPDLMAQRNAIQLSRFEPVHVKDLQKDWLRLDVEDEVMIGALRVALSGTSVRWLSLKVRGMVDVLFSRDASEPNSLPNLLRSLPTLEHVFLDYHAPEVPPIGEFYRPYDLTYGHLLALFETSVVPISVSMEMLNQRAYPDELFARLVELNQLLASPIEEVEETEHMAVMTEKESLIQSLASTYLWQDALMKALGRPDGLSTFLDWVDANDLQATLRGAYFMDSGMQEADRLSKASSLPSRSATISPLPFPSGASSPKKHAFVRRNMSGEGFSMTERPFSPDGDPLSPDGSVQDM